MAVIKEYPTPHGITATYHKIVKFEYAISTGLLEVVVAIYASAAARDAGGKPLWHEYVRIAGSDFVHNPLDLIYPLLMSSRHSYVSGGDDDEPGSPPAMGARPLILKGGAQGPYVPPEGVSL